jgi:glucose-1-phosphate thymidylyltransferase
MKGIILAGGTGSRLYPMTKVVSKQLLPIYNKPMIHYPLSILMLIGIKEILFITTKKDAPLFKSLFGDGSELGCSFSYEIQDHPNGIAEAFIIGEKFIGNDKVALILGDNIFYGSNLITLLKSQMANEGATVFGHEVRDPKRFGVVNIDPSGKIASIEEKPEFPKSNIAVTGIYMYDKHVSLLAKSIQKSKRGELEITSLNNLYLSSNQLNIKIIPRGISWLDTGTPDSLSEANEFVKVIEKTSNKKVACLEEISFEMGYINTKQLKILALKSNNKDYSNYLLQLIKLK